MAHRASNVFVILVGGLAIHGALTCATDGGTSGTNTAIAAPSDCVSWEVNFVGTTNSTNYGWPPVVPQLTEGWEPFASVDGVQGSKHGLWLRRCSQ